MLACIILCFALLRLIIALINLLFRQSLTIADKGNDLVTVIVPVRNEAKNIGNILEDLRSQTHSNLEIIVFDDQSSDNTAAIVNSIAATNRQVILLKSTGLPEGWLGKNHACHTASLNSKGKWFLFIDADVRLEPNVIDLALGKLKSERLGLLSIFPRQTMQTLGEQLTVPLMNQILLSLLPLILIRKSGMIAFSAANGQFMLFDGAIYKTLKPHEQFQHEKVEDLSIARYMKKQKIRIASIASVPEVNCRMYGSYYEALHGFSKNILQIFGGSVIVSILYWLVTTVGFLPVLLTFGLEGFLFYLVTVVLIRFIISFISHQNILKNIVNMIPQQITLIRIITLAIWLQSRKKLKWKDRNISL